MHHLQLKQCDSCYAMTFRPSWNESNYINFPPSQKEKEYEDAEGEETFSHLEGILVGTA